MILYLLGFILLLTAAFMILPMIVALFFSEKAGLAFLVTAAVCAVLGILLRLKKPKNTKFYAREGFVTVALSWIVISLAGAVPFRITGEIPNYLDAVFETVSGITTTGASILTAVEPMSKCLLFWRCFTNWLGGMGVLVFMLTILPGDSHNTIHLLKAESPGPSVSKIVPKMKESTAILYGMYVALGLIQLIFYLFGDIPVFDAICLTLATSGTGGFAVLNDSFGSYSMYIQGVTTVFMMLFGINFTLYFFMLRKEFRYIKENSELRWYFAIMAFAIVSITLSLVLSDRHYFDTVFEAFHHSAFAVLTCMSTCGFATADFDKWPEFAKIILVSVMFVGGCAGSTGGGLKVSRIAILIKSAIAEVRHELRPREVQNVVMDGKKLPQEIVKGVCLYFILYATLFALSIMLVALDNFDFTTTVTSVIATINNIGPGLGMVGPTGNFSQFSAFSKIILTLDMLFGRLELLPMMMLFMPGTWKKN